MNYVAHALLAPASPGALLGSLLGDFLKGPLPGKLDGALGGELARGVALHRAVDGFVDRHASFRATRRRFFPDVSHYAAVVADVVYDHLLITRWSRFASEDLDAFAARVYREIEAHADALPGDMGKRARRMVGFDVMRVYRDAAGVRGALTRLSARLRRPVDLTAALERLEADRASFESDFARLWPDLLAFRDRWVASCPGPQPWAQRIRASSRSPR